MEKPYISSATPNWHVTLAGIITRSEPGTVIYVGTDNMKQLAEIAIKRMGRLGELTVKVGEPA